MNIHAAGVLIAVLLNFANFVACQNFGDFCGPELDKHCKIGVGLICSGSLENSTCICAGGRFQQNVTSEMDYRMEWDPNSDMCLGVDGSLCVGTRRHPNPNEQNVVHCMNSLTCVQLPDYPNGVGVCKSIPSTSSYGSSCDENTYCEPSYGLICSNKTCICGEGVLDHENAFKLSWDEERLLCVAPVGTLCVGTKLHPLPIGAEKRVECESGVCTQLDGKPPGVGICQSEDISPTATTPTATTPTTTTPPSTTAGAKLTVVCSCSLISNILLAVAMTKLLF